MFQFKTDGKLDKNECKTHKNALAVDVLRGLHICILDLEYIW